MNAQSRLEQAQIPMSGIEEHITSPTAAPHAARSNIANWFATARLHGWPFVKHELQHHRRVQLASGASVAAVLLVAGFGISMIGHRPSAQSRTYGIAQSEAPFAPAATMARQTPPHRPSAADRPFKPTANSVGNGDDMAEFLRYGGQGQADAAIPPSPSATPVAIAAPRIDHAGTQSAPPTMSLPVVAATPVAATPVAAAPVAAAPAAAVAPPVTDPVTMATTLQASPMSDRKQRDVLDLVTQLGIIIRDQGNEIARLRADDTRLQHQIDQETDDHGRRLSLIEARDALQSAKTATNPDTKSASTVPVAATAATAAKPVTVRVQTTSIAPSGEPTSSAPHRYHVQAASPGLAMLSELDASGGELRQIPVSPGDDLPGWGKISSIAQHGTAWLVKTDHGLIQ